MLICVAGFFHNWLQKHLLVNHFDTLNKNEIPTETYHFISKFIDSIPLIDNLLYLSATVFIFIIGMLILRKSTEFTCFCKKTKIDYPLEFSVAFDFININDPHDQIQFIDKHNLSLYKSESSLSVNTDKEHFGKYYPFVRTHIRSDNYLFHAIGSKTLFVDKEEFDIILRKESIKNLPAKEQMNYNKVLEENTRLIKENKDIAEKLRLASAREGKSNIGNTITFYLGHLAVPLIERLKHNGHHNMYTDGRIKDELIKTLESYGEVFELIIKGNTNPSKKEPKDFITSTHISIVKDALGEFAKKRGKPPINKTF